MKILIADDDEFIRQLLQTILKKAGYEVVVVENGLQAFHEICRCGIRLAILDWKMPCMAGTEVCRNILNENLPYLVHMIILTGKKTNEDAVSAFQSGASDYISKPFNHDELLARVRAGERIINLHMQLSAMQEFAERKRREDELIKSEFMFRTVADFTWDWEFWMSPQKSFLYISPSCERISGYTPSDFTKDATHFYNIVHPEDSHALQMELERAFLRHTQTGFDFRIIHKDQIIRWVSIAYQPITDNEGAFLGVRGSIREITERKQTEKEIALLQTLAMSIAHVDNFNAALDVVLRAVCDANGWAFGEAWVPRPDGTLLECSPSWCSFVKGTDTFREVSATFTFPPEVGLPGRAWSSKKPVWIPNVTIDTNFPRAQFARECGFKTGIAIPILCNDTVIAVLQFFVLEEYDADEKIIRTISTIATQMGMFIHRKQLEDNLRLAHTQNRQLIAAIPSILIHIDDNDRVIEWNKTSECIFGIPSSIAIGRLFSECGIPWNDRGVIQQILNCRNTPQSTRIDDVRFINPLGKIGFLGLTVNPIKVTGKKQMTLLIIGNDITKRKIMESQLIQAQKLESIGQLAAGIAHEINTPTQYVGDNTRFLNDAFRDLCKVIGKYRKMYTASKTGSVPEDIIKEVETTEKEADVEYLTEEIPRAIQQSLEGIERVAKIVRAMKEFSHPGTDEKTPIDINKAIESTLTVARNEWKYVSEMVTVFDASLPLIPCLPDEFNQVILNIIINAAHAIGDVVDNGNKGKGIITVSTHRNGMSAEVRIQDTGTGIPEEARPKIFDPFFTTKGVGKGTGQGLAIAHDIIVKKHGGSINFETEVGKGTAFIIRIPIDDNHSERANSSP
ncbi:MAG: response regulator [Planctomycetes bacterium]|nr:response regulator [Planctomycetota bacterium]